MKSQKKAQLTVLALLFFAGSLALGDTQVQANEGSNAVKSVTMHRLYNPFTMEHFYTASSHERDVLVGRGWKYEGIGWYAPEKSNTPVYRLYNPFVNDHHYTMSSNEVWLRLLLPKR